MKTVRNITVIALSFSISGCASLDVSKTEAAQVQSLTSSRMINEVAATSLAYYYGRGVSKSLHTVYLDVKGTDLNAVLALANLRQATITFKGLSDDLEMRHGVLWEKESGHECLFLQITVKIVSAVVAEAEVYSSDLGWHISFLYKLRKSAGVWEIVEVLHGGDT